MLGSFLRVEKCVRSADDDRHFSTTELVSDVVGSQRVQRPGCEGYQVGPGVEIDGLELLVQKLDLPILGCERGKVGERQRHDIPVAVP